MRKESDCSAEFVVCSHAVAREAREIDVGLRKSKATHFVAVECDDEFSHASRANYFWFGVG